MVEVILLGREHGYERLEQTIRKALELGCSDVAAVRYLLLASGLERKQPEPIDATAFTQYDRPMLPLTNYDALLSGIEVVARVRQIESCARRVCGSTVGHCACQRWAVSLDAWPKKR